MTPLDIDLLVADLGVAVSTDSHHSRPGWVQMNCPFCGDTDYHLGYNRKKNYLHCYKCGAIDAHAWLEAVGCGKSVRELIKEFRLIRVRPIIDDKPVLADCKGVYRLPPQSNAPQEVHLRYIRSRGFSSDIVEKWGLLGTGHLGGAWSWRLIVPIIWNGVSASYQGRDVRKTERPKWLSAPPHKEARPIKSILYGLDNAPPDKPLLVVESAGNVWRMGYGAVATFGTTVTSEQVGILRRWKAGVVISFDPEPKAEAQAAKLANNLADFIPTSILTIDDYEDIAAMPQNKADKLKRRIWDGR